MRQPLIRCLRFVIIAVMFLAKLTAGSPLMAEDSPVLVGALGLLGLNLILTSICYAVLKSGWKLRS